MVTAIKLTFFHGFGPITSGIKANINALKEILKEQGLLLLVEDVTVPATDEEFEPVVLVNGVEVHVPAVEVDPLLLAEHLLSKIERVLLLAGFPLPPLSIIDA